MKRMITKFLVKLLYCINPDVFKQELQSINKQDLELISKNFPVFTYKNDMSIEQIAIGTAKSVGEQKVISFILSRIKGRIGQGVMYD